MGDVVDLEQRRRARWLAEAMEDLSERMRAEVPAPETFGWVPMERDAVGRALRWFHKDWKAVIGFVPGFPERVYLDHRHEIRAWDELTIEELALGLEMGTVPTPDVVLGWDGTPVPVADPDAPR